MPGPAPKVNSVRRGGNQRADTLSTALRVLPRSGRPGDPPPWPLPGKPARAALEAWADLWRLPQAVAWEEQALERLVARYVRTLIRAEAPKATAAVMAEARQLEDRLGLSSMAMLRLRWSVGDVPDAATEGEAEALAAVLFYDSYSAALHAPVAGALAAVAEAASADELEEDEPTY